MLEKQVPAMTAQTLSLLHTLREHRTTITVIAWSPDGKTLASGSSDRTIRIWDAATWQSHPRLIGHASPVRALAWSPAGHILASGSDDQTIRLWNTSTWQSPGLLTGHTSFVSCLAWSPDGRMLASGAWDRTIRLWDGTSGELRQTLLGHIGTVYGVAWAPNGSWLVSSSEDRTIRCWDVRTGQLLRTFTEHRGAVRSVAWSPDQRILATGSDDQTIRFWDMQQGKPTNVLEGHTGAVFGVSFSADGRFLASKSKDGTVQVWRCDTCETVEILYEVRENSSFEEVPNWLIMSPSGGPAFHPLESQLATLGTRDDTAIRVWQVDFEALRTAPSVVGSVHYTNAKVVLMGDTGVGKSGLALALTGQPFHATESTHGRHVWPFDRRTIDLGAGRQGRCDVLLWDLSGQPGYRLVHQLHLNDTAVALVVFDARSETEPFAGVRYWNRALSQAQRIHADSAPRLKKLLVSARADRGGVGVGKARIETLVRELGFDGYFETSAKEGWGIAELSRAIREAVVWESLPQVSSTSLFQRIQAFLTFEKEDAGHLLTTIDELYTAFRRFDRSLDTSDDLRAQFITCIGRVESHDLIRRLSFGKLILLRPELLDTYASALVNAAKDEPDGLGSIREQAAQQGLFPIPDDKRVKDPVQEHLLLIATIEDLLYHEIALREHAAEGGPYLVFPSELTRERQDLPDPEGKAVIFTFDGPVFNIYATLAVRLSHSEFFTKEEMWKNAAAYRSQVGGTCGLFLQQLEEGRAEVILFFDKHASEETRFQFEEYVAAHLQRRAIPESIQRRRIFVCPKCGEPVPDAYVKRRRERGFNWIMCGICGDVEVSLLDREELLTATRRSRVLEMDRAADAQRERETAASVLNGKRATGDFDVFVSYSADDEPWVRNWLLPHLEQNGVYAYVDTLHFDIGVPRLQNIERAMQRCPKTLLILTPNWLQSEWQTFEGLLLQTKDPVNVQRRIVPVLLAECELPDRLAMFTCADFTQRSQWEHELIRIVRAMNDQRSWSAM